MTDDLLGWHMAQGRSRGREGWRVEYSKELGKEVDGGKVGF